MIISRSPLRCPDWSCSITILIEISWRVCQPSLYLPNFCHSLHCCIKNLAYFITSLTYLFLRSHPAVCERKQIVENVSSACKMSFNSKFLGFRSNEWQRFGRYKGGQKILHEILIIMAIEQHQLVHCSEFYFLVWRSNLKFKSWLDSNKFLLFL